jgi:glycosyltransferase involved in cell wall biosynthesis
MTYPLVDVLQVPFRYAPDPMGGTEVYVAALCRELRACGLAAAVAAPATADADYRIDDVAVHRYGIPDGLVGPPIPARIAALKRSFAAMLDRVRPRLVHFHALSPGIDAGCAEAVTERGLPLVLTYHTPTLSCARGTLMAFGRQVCDGVYRAQRCTSCVAQKLSGSSGVATALAAVPVAMSRLAAMHLPGRLGTALGLGAAVQRQQDQFQSIIARASRVIAVCEWVREVLLRHGVPADRLLLSRQGLPQRGSDLPAVLPGHQTLRLCFFGRLDPTKGVDVLLDALALSPGLPVRLDLYGVPEDPAYQTRLQARIASDPRCVLKAPVPSAGVLQSMQEYDAVVVPSQWLETGPLVVLEAWAAGRPVIGSNLGGIAELVRDGVDGWLLPPTDPGAWARLFEELQAQRDVLTQRAAAIRPPRTMADVALEMASVYCEVGLDRRESMTDASARFG